MNKLIALTACVGILAGCKGEQTCLDEINAYADFMRDSVSETYSGVKLAELNLRITEAESQALRLMLDEGENVCHYKLTVAGGMVKK